MTRYIVRRLLLLLPVLLGVSAIVFAVLRAIPGDPVMVMLGTEAGEGERERLRAVLGLDEPVPVQFLRFLVRVLTGDLGRSITQGAPVLNLVLGAMPATVELALASLLISLLIALPLGVLAAVNERSPLDWLSMVLALVGVSMPIFWFGMLLILLFSLQLGWLPAFGRGAPLIEAAVAALGGNPSPLQDSLSRLVMPALALGLNATAIIARLTRGSMLEVLRQDYVRTARAKGLREWTVIVRHGLKNALLPVVTVLGLQFGALLGGAIVTENVFAWPGVGRLVVVAINQRDYPVVQGGVLLVALTFSLVNLAVDLSYAWLNPRIRYS